MASCIELSDIEAWEYIDEPIVYDIAVVNTHCYYISAGKDILVHNSGKTFAICQLLLTIATTHQAPSEDPVITIVGATVPDLKKGAYFKAKEIIYNTLGFADYIANINETDRVITFKSGWIMQFTSYQTIQQAKQGKRQYLFVNEAQGTPWLVFWELAKRTRIRTFIDYNPTAPFWAHEKLIGTTKETNDLYASIRVIISDHRHNTFLSQKDHDRTEGIKDKDLFNVYARGLTGNVAGLIFPDWQTIPESDYPHDSHATFGVDFGFTNDPTAIVKATKIGNRLYVKELCYDTGISHTQIKQILFANGCTNMSLVLCDHDPEMINSLRSIGVQAVRAIKGQGSVNSGITRLKGMEVFYSELSKNIHMEKNRYMWFRDPKTGKSTNEPIDQFNHLMDAIRYSQSMTGQSF